MNVMLLCKQCNQPFTKSKYAPRKDYCSTKCRDRNCYIRIRAHLHMEEKTCGVCGNKFIATRNRHKRKYCSSKCYKRSPEDLARQLKHRRTPEDLLYHREYHRNRRMKLMDCLGGQICKNCSFQEYHLLQFDHISPKDAVEDTRRFGNSGATFVGYYLRNIDEAKEKLQVLCSTCNQAKRRKY